ncbi:DUF4406 domain-containing protein [Streptacidiphilus sp. PB12-B1b]|uniref:DUF4406 domain-containing protein n=1 Tax=Streptacidiphilus sp. PB12-B1b TaxID=2705012 RepID=UPI001CDB9B85|nr:DUF4406 domain-containing protein [Streptacidiphilus sp. PB12-B1b]
MSAAPLSTAPLPTAPRPLMVLVAGPYRSGTGDDPARLAAHARAMHEAALDLFRAGHLAVTGEALALPLLEAAGGARPGDAAFEEIFHPVAERLLARCDAVLRIGGASAGADMMVRQARAAGKAVYTSADEIPRPEGDLSPDPISNPDEIKAAR